MEYLAYDIKGIQQFIYSIPRLKSVIGTSSQIYEFDDELSRQIARDHGANFVFTGGGRGVFRCTRDKTEEFTSKLVQAAHAIGLDIRIGVSEDFSIAIKNATKLFPYLPPDTKMSGVPCAFSGLWPVGHKPNIHPLVLKRLRCAKEDRLGRFLLQSIDPQLLRSVSNNAHVEFFLNVHPERIGDDEEESRDVDRDRASAGSWSLGNRNRWAIIALDGNDIGGQFDALSKLGSQDQETLGNRLGVVSRALMDLTKDSLVKAIEHALTLWSKSSTFEPDRCGYVEAGEKRFVLPIRPLVCGGDDVVLLCHSSLAMQLVESMCKSFEDGSIRRRTEILSEHGFDPWPATGALSMSAGILYSSVSLPLHVGIPYAQSLLDSAKAKYRRPVLEGQPSPAAVDWEAVTDSMVDTPTARRRRELVFNDAEIHSRIQLTRKPYLLFEKDSLQGRRPSLPALRREFVEPLRKMPSSFRAELQYRLAQPWSERTLYLLSAGKVGSRSAIVKKLHQPGNGSPPSQDSAWVVPTVEIDGKLVPETHGGLMIQETGVVDAILLVEEESRMQVKGTVRE